MLHKGRAAEGFARRPDPDVWAVLAFGEDEGLAFDAGQSLIASWGGKHGMDVTVLDDDAVRKEPALLFDALEAVSLLGDARAVRLRTSGDKIAALIIEAIEIGDKDPARFAAKLIIEAGSLPAKSKLRGAAESAKRAACLQLFAEEEADVAGRVKTALLAEGAVIDPPALDAFVGDLPGNRALANSEIEKLALYARGLGRPLTLEDIRALSATDVKQAISGVINAALDGRPGEAHHALDKLAENGTSGISILRSLQMEVLRMLSAHEKIAGGDGNPGKYLRPPIWPNEWPAFRVRLGKWPAKRLMRIMERIHDAERQTKVAGPSGDPVVRLLINDLAKAAEAVR
ncbi:DNA polymerase III subunit delta [Hyphomonas sp. WL0036]|uniref:DNA polymerase III subunit delta n=1 Tax=Hyphomonas sediminis TaxID=2866160 RepID=UPI001C8104EC|nr:DNA polymerase III subunit delta [Hyphomonas sediminis]MBY9065927.1 DNA polymerase III subunit delta [Hyphomonas sediminis]